MIFDYQEATLDYGIMVFPEYLTPTKPTPANLILETVQVMGGSAEGVSITGTIDESFDAS